MIVIIFTCFVRFYVALLFIICCLSFAGVHVHINDVRIIIQWGTPKDVLSYWQQTGLAGRDGKAAEGILFATRTTYHKQVCRRSSGANYPDQAVHENVPLPQVINVPLFNLK